jgi:dienelactone hydrolase
VEIRTYPGTVPGFCNETRADSFQSDRALEAWDVMAIFLAEHLKA